jgi:hypothetical protein
MIEILIDKIQRSFLAQFLPARRSIPGGKAWPRSDANNSPTSSAVVKNEKELSLLSPLVPACR